MGLAPNSREIGRGSDDSGSGPALHTRGELPDISDPIRTEPDRTGPEHVPAWKVNALVTGGPRATGAQAASGKPPGAADPQATPREPDASSATTTAAIRSLRKGRLS